VLRVALKMLFGDRAKYLSLVFGLSFAVLLVTQQLAFFLGLMLQSSGPLQNISTADLWVADSNIKWVSETRYLTATDLNRVRSVPGVAWAEPLFSVRAAADMSNGNFRWVNLVGVPRSTMVGRPPEITQGRLSDLKIPDAVLVEEHARARLGDPRLGETLRLNDRRAVVVGYCRAKTGWDSQALLYTTYENAITFTPLGRGTISFVLVKARDGENALEVQKRINALPGLLAMTPTELRFRSANFIMRETGIGINFSITVSLGVIVGLTISGAIFYQFTLENLRHFAVLKAMGLSRLRLCAVVLTQALVVGLVGWGIGMGLAAGFCVAVRAPGSEIAAHFPWHLTLVALGGMLICTGFGSILSLRRVLMLDPAVVFK
jgi:putative ABC transport system permease protein